MLQFILLLTTLPLCAIPHVAPGGKSRIKPGWKPCVSSWEKRSMKPRLAPRLALALTLCGATGLQCGAWYPKRLRDGLCKRC